MRKAIIIIAAISVIFLTVFLLFFTHLIRDKIPIGQAMHPLFPGFAMPTSGFLDIQNIAFNSTTASNTIHISSSDTIIYRRAYYSLDGKSWSPITLSGNYYSGSNIWLNGSATGSITVTPENFNLSSSRNISKNNYIVIYSCKISGNRWDCHNNSWQIRQFNATLKTTIGNTQTTTTSSTGGSSGGGSGGNTQTSGSTGGSSGGGGGGGGSGGNTQTTGNTNTDGNTQTTTTQSTSGRCDTSSDCNPGEYCSNNVCLLTVPGKTYFVALNGNDNNSGNFTHPFATWQKAVLVSRPGDITYIRGGVWYPTTYLGYSSSIAMSIRPESGVGASGTAQAPIRYYNYPGETPIIDGSLMTVNEFGWLGGIDIQDAEYIYLKGFTIRELHQGPPGFPAYGGKNYSEAFGIGTSGANFRFENIIVHDIDGRGFRHWGEAWTELDGPNTPFESDNTSWINCDAYNLFDRYAMEPGNAADGWKVQGYYGNHFYWEGCRAWNYSDDGFDPSGQAYRYFKNCWASSTDKYSNETARNLEKNGFKMTGVNSNYVPNYVTGKENFVRMENSIAADCSGVGIYNNILVNPNWGDDAQSNRGIFYNNFAYKNDIGYSEANTNTSSTYRNNIVYDSQGTDAGGSKYELSFYLSYYNESHNTWIFHDPTPGSIPWWLYNPAFNVTEDDFVSLDASQLQAPRKADGSLPDITFGHLRNDSELIDAGMIIPGYHCTTAGEHPGEDCVEWYGNAPDIGPFEYKGEVTIVNNSCDGATTRSLSCGVGACLRTVSQSRTCNSGSWSDWSPSCTAGSAANETCNNIDDDCDGSIDDGISPQTRSCSISNGAGTQSSTCILGTWSSWNTCTVTSCNSGFTQSGNTCIVYVPPSGGQIIADHTIVDRYDDIPSCYMDRVKTMMLDLAGESHRGAYIDGLILLEEANSDYALHHSSYPDSQYMLGEKLRVAGALWGDYNTSEQWVGSHGEEDWFTNAAGIAAIKYHLLRSKTENYNISAMGFAWCYDAETGHVSTGVDPVYGVHWYGNSIGGPEGDLEWGLDAEDYSLTGNSVSMDSYISATQEYIDYCAANNIPTKIFFTTGPIDAYAASEISYQGYLKWEHLRDYIDAHPSTILFDYADILSYNDAGTLSTTTWEGHTYPHIHPDNMGGNYSGHIGTVGALRLGKAEWWMLARMSGWDGVSTDCS